MAERHDARCCSSRSTAASWPAPNDAPVPEEIGSPRIRALLDPANLLEVNDLEEMFEPAQPWIDCLHAKDRKLHVDQGVPAGQGDLDYVKFVTLAADHTPNAPLVLEYVGPSDYQRRRVTAPAGRDRPGRRFDCQMICREPESGQHAISGQR